MAMVNSQFTIHNSQFTVKNRVNYMARRQRVSTAGVSEHIIQWGNNR
jgi:hypothetical protein